jgi:DNA polymerase-3 subunit gamma/tau
MADAQPYQSLYRRFRPQKFSEIRGQEHVTRALRNAVRDGRVAHAYLFSGPRGTGKTSTARVLAKALNCTNLQEGEPCDECESCAAIRAGASLDVFELDAASNSGVDAMRDLVARVSLGNPGRWKVYIVDEVHMLSAAASNALLKTLEEPPGHVVFVLATTDPQKVLPTIRSRTQHYEFRLLPSDVLAGLLSDVNEAAGLGVPEGALELVMRRGNGSARDALSVLDQVAVSSADVEQGSVDRVEELVDAIADRDAGRALLAVAEACAAGADPRRLANDVLEQLRNAFLLSMKAAELVAVPDVARDRLAEQAARFGAAGLTRAMEAIGQAVVDMREALDPRITLEVAVVRLARPDADISPAALLERIERLEKGLSGHVTEPARVQARAAAERVSGEADGPGGAGAGAAPSSSADSTSPPPTSADAPGGPLTGPAASRAALGALRPQPTGSSAKPANPAKEPPRVAAPPPPPGPGQSAPSVEPGAKAGPAPTPPPAAASDAGLPSRDELTKAWGDKVLTQLPPKARSRYAGGRFSGVEGGAAVYALPNAMHRDRCEEVRPEVEAVLAAHFGRPVPLRLVVDAVDTMAPDPPPGALSAADEEVVPEDLVDEAEAAVASPEDRLRQVFPGITEVDQG